MITAPEFKRKKAHDYDSLSIGVFGTGELARVAEHYIRNRSQLFSSYIYSRDIDNGIVDIYDAMQIEDLEIWRTVDSQYIKMDDHTTLPFNGLEVDKKSVLFMPIGYKNCNKTREEKTNQAKEKGFNIMSFIDSKANIHSDTKIEEGCWIQEGCNVQTGSTIGNGTIMWASSHVGHGSSVGDFCWITTHATICGEVNIDNNTFIGANAVITPGVYIGKRCIIGSGAIITKDLPDDSVALEGRNNIIAKKSYEIEMR